MNPCHHHKNVRAYQVRVSYLIALLARSLSIRSIPISLLLFIRVPYGEKREGLHVRGRRGILGRVGSMIFGNNVSAVKPLNEFGPISGGAAPFKAARPTHKLEYVASKPSPETPPTPNNLQNSQCVRNIGHHTAAVLTVASTSQVSSSVTTPVCVAFVCFSLTYSFDICSGCWRLRWQLHYQEVRRPVPLCVV